MLATDLADYLVRKGVPFRKTHHISGRAVALAEREGKPMDQLSKQQLQEVDNKFGDDVLDCFNYEKKVLSIGRRKVAHAKLVSRSRLRLLTPC